ncbi:MAG: response regulator [Lachnospiraceae bacterium]|nr:response regulator [Lachnospiraceae bacterium]
MKKYLFPFNLRSIAIIIIGFVFNLMGRGITENYSLPLFGDTIGTFWTAIMLGPVAGSVTGILTNLVSLIWAPFDWIYLFVNVTGAVIVGHRLYKRDRVDLFAVVSTAVMAILAMTIVSTPLNMMLNSGFTGNAWGDALIEMLSMYIGVKVICQIAGELIVNIPDKLLSLIIIVYSIRLFEKMGVTIRPDEEEKRKEAKDAGSLIFFIGLLSALSFYSVRSETVYAADNVDFNSDFVSTIYGVNDGLNSVEINSVTQTGDGYMWAGAYSGIYRYDSTEFKQFIPGNRISNAIYLFTDRKGRLWVCTNDAGVFVYDTDTRRGSVISTEDGLSSDYVRGICEDRNGNIYLATTSSINCLRTYVGQDKLGADGRTEEDQLFTSCEISEIRPIEEISNVSSLLCTKHNDICGITETGLLFSLSDGVLMDTMESSLSSMFYTAAGYDGDSLLLVGTTSNSLDLVRIKNGNLIREDTIELPHCSGVNRILYKDRYKGFFICCDNGIAFVDKEGNFQDLTMDGFDSAIADVTVDKQGNIWFSSTKHGILKMSVDPFSDLFDKIGESDRVVNSICIDNNIVYIGTDDGVIKTDIKAGKKLYDEKLSHFDGTRIRHIYKDTKGGFWFSTYGKEGLVYLSPDGNFTVYNDENSGALGSRFRFVRELRDGRILAASNEGLTYFKDNKVVKTLGVNDGIDVPKILACDEAEDGTLIIGTDGGGVYEIKDDKVYKHWGKAEGLLSLVVMKIVPVSGGSIYVASNGLYYHPHNALIKKLVNFPYQNNYNIYISEDHRAFISSSAGLYVAEEADIISDNEDYPYSLLNRKYGLNTTLTSNSFDGFCEDKMYLCCTDGVKVLNINEYDKVDPNYSIVLNSLTKEGEDAKLTKGMYILEPGNGQVLITPAVLNYTATDPLVSVFLEGVDKEAIVARQSAMETMYYPEIPFGDHKLIVSVLSDSGQSIKEKVFLIHKDAKLYEKTYYKVYLIICSMILFILIIWLLAKMGNMAVINRQYNEIREAKEDAELANQAKSRFLAQMSHEIRTPINAVLGMDEMILRETTDPDIRSYARDIYTAGQTLLSLINDILDSSKMESGKMEIVPEDYELSGMIKDLVNMITARAQAKDLKLITEVDKELPRVLNGDDIRIKQVVTNILTNAVKYTNTGSVTLRVGGERRGDILLLKVEVEDTGIGIKEEDLPKLFMAFQRIEENRNRTIEGTGLGMNITIQLLEMMGSELKVSSIYGKGSKFSFELEQPVVDDSPIGDFDKRLKEDDIFETESKAFTAENAHVLVVDDNSMNRKVFKSLLKPLLVKVSEAGSGAEALAKVGMESFDMIFMDHMMPEMDGVETMKKIKEQEEFKDIPVFVLTANAVAGAKDEYIKMGFDGFLSKPVALDKLEDAMRETLPDELIHYLTPEEAAEQRGVSSSKNTLPEGLPDVDGLDWSYAFMHLPGEELLRENVGSFFDIILPQADKLDRFYAALKDNENDEALEEYRILVHGMKSAAATVGIVPLAGMAKVLEFAARDKNLKVIYSMHETFIYEWRSYEEKLKAVIGERESTEEAAEKKNGDSAILEASFDILSTALEDMDIDAADDIMNKLTGYSFGEDIDGLIKKLNGAVKNLDEDEAHAIMDQIKNNMENNGK